MEARKSIPPLISNIKGEGWVNVEARTDADGVTRAHLLSGIFYDRESLARAEAGSNLRPVYVTWEDPAKAQRDGK